MNIVKTSVLAFSVALAACAASPGGSPPPATTSSGDAMVRVIHASPDAPAVDVWAKGAHTPLLTNLRYGDASAYLDLAPGSYDLQLRAWPSSESDPVVYEADGVNVAAGARISAIAAGLLDSTVDASRFRIVALAETESASTSKTMVRIVHACGDAPSVGIDVGNDDPAAPEIASLDRWADVGPTPLPAGQSLAIGIDVANARFTSFTTPALPTGDLLVIATGEIGVPSFGDASFSLLAVGPKGSIGFIKQDPIVYALHDGADAPAVDAFVGDAKIIDDLSFGQLTKAIQVQPGTYSLDFFAHTDGTTRPAGKPVVTESTGALEAGQRYLSIATGLLAAQPGFRLVTVAEKFALDDQTHARVRAVHGAPEAPTVDLGVATSSGLSPVVFSQLSFGGASDDDVALAKGQVTVGVAPSTNDANVIYKLPLSIDPGKRFFAIAAGAPQHGVPFRLVAIETTATPWTVTHVFPQ